MITAQRDDNYQSTGAHLLRPVCTSTELLTDNPQNGNISGQALFTDVWTCRRMYSCNYQRMVCSTPEREHHMKTLKYSAVQ